MLEEEDEMMDEGGMTTGMMTPSRSGRLLGGDDDDEEEDEDMEKDDDFAGTSHAASHLHRPASGTPGPARMRESGSCSVQLVPNEELDPTEFENNDDDEEEDIVDSPCPPGIWLNVGGFTPNGKSHSPF